MTETCLIPTGLKSQSTSVKYKYIYTFLEKTIPVRTEVQQFIDLNIK